MRAHLLTTTAAVALLAATSAQAQNATWNLNGTGVYNTPSNWTPNTVPTGTASFGPSSQNNVSISSAITNSRQLDVQFQRSRLHVRKFDCSQLHRRRNHKWRQRDHQQQLRRT